MVRIAFHYLGCRLNEAENEAIARSMTDKGHEIVAIADNPDVIVLNTCGVTADAMRKSRNLMRRFAAAGARLLVLMGCAVDLMQAGENSVSDDDLRQGAKRDDDLRIVRIYRDDRPKAADIIARAIDETWNASVAQAPTAYKPRIRCFIKIEDGCNNACTYCSVRLARGRERSVAGADIVEEIRRCLALGEREIVLTGVQLGAWKEGDRRLPDLIGDILSKTDVERLRLSSIEPWHLRPELYELWSDKRLCPHFHTPVQSGSDAVLSMMRRRTHLAEFESKINDLRRKIPNVRVSTDLIVGFPGETDAMWRETLDFIERIGFDDIHLFRFSARPGTIAATLPNPVAPEVKRERWNEAHDRMMQIKRDKMQASIGALCRVLWETRGHEIVDGKRRWSGYAENYLRLYRYFDADRSMRGTVTCEIFGENDIATNIEQDDI
ncbi:MAG: MiaB/RimO family radical SAM methylthiotransferase [Bradymonadales bacterium]|nr:MiaB/RimO family radical SAM methylthiotransferase [Bradymonadales bacterium]